MTNINDFKPFDSDDKFSSKEEDILARNQKFFSFDSKYIDTMLKIIEGKSNISIRVLDWFVANYSKKNNTYYKISISGSKSLFYVHNEYKNQLNGYSKLYFDPFCRKKKIVYRYQYDDRDINFVTSIGQLNFFQWAIRNKVIKYVENNVEKIELDMKVTNKANREKKLNIVNEPESESEEEEDRSKPDPAICSSDSISTFMISPNKKVSSTTRSDSEKRKKRQQLSKSVYQSGIKKYNVNICLDFD
jgi:hypothetical protein